MEEGLLQALAWGIRCDEAPMEETESMALTTRSAVRFGLVALVMIAGMLGKNALTADAPMHPATYIGEQQCIACHGQENAHFRDTLHAKVFRQNPKNDQERQVCEACHGPGSLHAKDVENKNLIIGFTREWGTSVEKQTAQCLTCHQGGNRMHWPGSAHAGNKLSCSDCHNPMAKFSAQGLLKKPARLGNQATAQGGQRQRTLLRLSRRKTWPLHLGTRAGSGKLHELSFAAWLEPRQAAADRPPAVVPTVPRQHQSPISLL